MELIPRDEAIAMLEDMEGRRDEDGYIRVYKLDVIDNLRSLPSIDLVRCRECKYWYKNSQSNTGGCSVMLSTGLYAGGFCSYGERRE